MGITHRHTTCQNSIPSENKCYAVICTASEIDPSEAIIKDNAKNALEDVLRREDLNLDVVHKHMVISNSRGLALAEQSAKVRSLGEGYAKQKAEISALKAAVSQLECNGANKT